jgi:hypothetical protein
MDPDLFNVIFTGKLIDGFDIDTVVEAFAEKFRLPIAKAEKVIKANRDLVLKPRLEHVKAYKLKSTLEAIGIEVRLERAAPVESVVLADSPTQDDEPISAPSIESKSEFSDVSNPELNQNESNTRPPDDANKITGSASWSLEPILKEDLGEEKEEAKEKPTERVLFTTKVEHVYQPEKKPQVSIDTNEEPTDKTVRSKEELIKISVVVGLVVVVVGFVLLKIFS